MEDDRISIHQIVAIDENGGIGLNGDLPWKLQKDWQHFLRMTTKVKVDYSKKSLPNNRWSCSLSFKQITIIKKYFHVSHRAIDIPMFVGYLEGHHLKSMLNKVLSLILLRKRARSK